MFKVTFAALFLASAVSMLGSNVGVSPCGSATLASYDNSYPPPSAGCSIGILDYSNFDYVALQNAPSASVIEVTPSSSAGSNGFSFTQVGGQPFTASGNVVQFAIYYNIFIDPAPVIPSANTTLDPPMGNVSVTEYFCNDSTLYPGTTSCFPPSSPAYSLTVTTASPSASVTFNPPAQKSQTVGIIFTLDGTKGVASFDGLDTNTVVTVTPEPVFASTIGLLLLAGSLRLRKRNR